MAVRAIRKLLFAVLEEVRELLSWEEWFTDWPKPPVSEERSPRNGSFRTLEIDTKIAT